MTDAPSLWPSQPDQPGRPDENRPDPTGPPGPAGPHPTGQPGPAGPHPTGQPGPAGPNEPSAGFGPPTAYAGPGPYTPPWSGSYGPYGPPPARRTGGPPAKVWIAIGASVGAVVLVILLVVVMSRAIVSPVVTSSSGGRSGQERADTVAAAASTLNTSPGLVYRGRVKSYSGGPVDAAVTVDRDGTLRGEVTRASGGHAEFAILGTEAMVRGDAEWYRGDPPANVAKVTDQWVRDPYGNGSVTDLKSLFPAPEELKNKLTRYSSAYTWSTETRQQIRGVNARVIQGTSNDVAIDESSAPPQLVSWTNHASDIDNTLSVAQATPSDLALITEVPTLQASTPSYSDRVVYG